MHEYSKFGKVAEAWFRMVNLMKKLGLIGARLGQGLGLRARLGQGKVIVRSEYLIIPKIPHTL